MLLDYPFSDHMVLQRNKDIYITGKADGTTLTITIDDYIFKGNIVNGRFRICLYFDKPLFSTKMSFISDEESYDLYDICIGDVFLAAGQSNIEWLLKDTTDTYIKPVKYPVRILSVPQYVYPFNQKETSWQVYVPPIALQYSALISQFIKHLNSNIPIGIILNYKGGTSASCWLSEEYLNQDIDLKRIYIDNYWKDLPNKDIQYKQTKEYYEAFNNYQKQFKEYQNTHPNKAISEIKEIIGHTPWPPPKGYYDYSHPSCLYKNMFLKTVNYPITAIIYYQGEEDSKYNQYYQKLLMLLIKNWRNMYQEELPFYLIQLPEYNDDMFSGIRNAQREVSLLLDYVYLVVAIGTGDSSYIHPLSKDELGRRLALYVEKYTYHKEHILSPIIKEIVKRENEIEIIFDQKLKNNDVHLNVDNSTVRGRIEYCKLIIPCIYQYFLSYADKGVPAIELMNEAGMPVSPFIIY